MKIKRMFYLLAVTMLCISLTTSCNDDEKCDDKDVDKGLPAPSFTDKVNNSVYGFVTDENDKPMSGVLAKAGGKSATTDAYGYFEIEDAQVTKGAGTVTAEKNGYFTGIRTWVTEANKKQFVRIKLLPKTIAGTFTTDAGGSVSLQNGLKLNFPANSIVEKGSGNEYKGTVSVALQWINPVSPYLSEMMPGDLRALNEEGLMQGLITYGMVAAEMTSADGKILQMAEGKTVELRTPIESELSANAPTEMPLWYFDEEKGFWVEQGKTVRQGNEYVGQVSHFSFWNCDVPYNFVYFKCRIVDAAGEPMKGYTVSIKSSNYSYAYSYTDNEGYVSGYVPKNSNLTMYVYSAANRDCIIYSKTFSTTTSDVDLGTITVNETTTKTAKVKGTVINCNGDFVTKGYMNFTYGTSYYRADIKDGEYEFTLYFCEDIATLDAVFYDLDNLKMESVQFKLVNGENNIDQIMICDDIEGSYIILNGDNEIYLFNDYIRVLVGKESTAIDCYHDAEQKAINFCWKGKRLQTGEFDFEHFYAGSSNNANNKRFEMDEQSIGKVTISKFISTNSNPERFTIIGKFEIKNVLFYQYSYSRSEKSDPDNPNEAIRKDVSCIFKMEDFESYNMPE